MSTTVRNTSVTENDRAAVGFNGATVRIDPREPAGGRIGHLFVEHEASSVLPFAAETVDIESFRRYAIATSQRLSELSDQLRKGCWQEDCLAIRDAAYAAAKLLDCFEDSRLLIPICQQLERPHDDWNFVVQQARRLLKGLDNVSDLLRERAGYPVVS